MIFAIVSFSSKWINFLVRENDKIAWHPAFCDSFVQYLFSDLIEPRTDSTC